ncbi:MAG: hypothetical protein ACI4WR_01695, partial [Bulleidia sp.]
MTEQYRFSPEMQSALEASPVPFAVYQLVDHRIAAILVSDGFLKLTGEKSREACIHLMNTNMYRDTDPADTARIEDQAYRFATGADEVYDAVYRSRIQGQNEYHLIHSMGKHFLAEGKVPLVVIWYMDETGAAVHSHHGQELTEFLNAEAQAE